MLACWRMWAGLLCYTDGPSCPMQPTPANAKAPAMRRRCSSTPGWLARTVPKGSCSTAPKYTASHHWTFLIYVNTHFPVMFVHFCLCMSMCRIAVCDVLLPLPVVSPCLALHRLEQCSSQLLSTYACLCVTHWPHSHLFNELNFIHQWIPQHPFSCSSCASFCLIWLHTGTSPLDVILILCLHCFDFFLEPFSVPYA